MMKALVTGGHGFIGSFLVERLLSEGSAVRCLVKKSSNLQWIKNLAIEICYGDITQKETLREAVQDVDFVFHVAGAIRGATREKYFSVNTQGTVDLAEATLKYAPHLRRFVFVSSVSAIGPTSGRHVIQDENSECHPVTDYGKSKLQAELDLKRKFPNLPLTIIRPPIVYGPRDTNSFQLFQFAKRGFFPVPVPFERYYSIVHARDLADGIFEASRRSEALGKTYIVCNSEYHSFEDMGKKMSKPFSKNPIFIRLPRIVVRCLAWGGDIYSFVTKKDVFVTSKKIPDLYATSWIFSPKKIERELGFKTKIGLEEGAFETAEWYKRNNYL